MAVTQSESSDEATAKIEANMEKLRKMDMAKGYLELLNGFDKLRLVIFLGIDIAFTYKVLVRMC